MKLHLVRHGEALARGVDGERPLSEAGRAQVEQLAAFLGRAGVRVARVAHSGKARARQTAELLAAAVAPGVEIEARSGLDPLDPVEPLAGEAEGWRQDAMLVGHLPFMGALASLLLSGLEDTEIVTFRPASIACLERAADGGWSLAWAVDPELVRGGAS